MLEENSKTIGGSKVISTKTTPPQKETPPQSPHHHKGQNTTKATAPQCPQCHEGQQAVHGSKNPGGTSAQTKSTHKLSLQQIFVGNSN
jgi:hypothetical protein